MTQIHQILLDKEFNEAEKEKASLKKACLAVTVFLMAGALLAGIEFKGMTWYHSADPSGLLFTNAQQRLEWHPREPHQLTVRIPEQRLSESGDTVQLRLKWKSDGTSGCNCANETEFYGDFCNDDSIDCLAGTGDFRMGLFDSNQQGYVEEDGLGTTPEVFSGYLGYSWRWFPHLSPDTLRRVYQHKEEEEKESHTNLGFWERTKPESSILLSSSSGYNRLGQPLAGGFGLPLGAEGILELRLERLSPQSVRMVIEMNGHKFQKTDTTPKHQPEQIDVFAIQFPNARPYDYVILDTVSVN